MKSSQVASGAAGHPGGARLLRGALLALTLFLPAFATADPGDALGKEELACLKCHEKEGETKALGDGKQLSITISTKAYIDSMHNGTTCTDCHADLDDKKHGKVKTPLASRRELSLSMQHACDTCHKKKAKEHADSVHAALVAAGSEKAPLCSDCHEPHTQPSVKVVQPLDKTPCAKCHEEIFKAYSADVHGVERAAKGKAAPLCYDCHQAHAVKPAFTDTKIKDACFNCHKEAVKQHQDWLPNALRHFEAVSCPACHAPEAHRRVNLVLLDAKDSRALKEKVGVPKFEQLTKAADANKMGLDEHALWSIVRELSRDGLEANTVLRGRLEVRSGKEAHQIAAKDKAIKNCDTCHKEGSAAFQSVTLSMAGADGRPLRHSVQKDVLSSLTSLESVRGFYAIGATRIKLLDTLLVMVVLGAACVPLGHMVVKWMFRKVRAKVEAERAAANGKTNDGDSAR